MNRKQRTKQIIVCSFIFFLLLIGGKTTSKAIKYTELKNTTPLNTTVTFTKNDYHSQNTTLFCVQHGQDVGKDGEDSVSLSYQLVGYLKIKGNEGYVNNSSTPIRNEAFAQIGYLLSNVANNSMGSPDDAYIQRTYGVSGAQFATMFPKNVTFLQNIFWKDNIFNPMNIYLKIPNVSGFATSSNSNVNILKQAGTSSGFAALDKAYTYANTTLQKSVNWRQSETIKDQTNKNNIGVTVKTYSGEQCVRVGPFKWSFTNKPSTITVKTTDGTSYTAGTNMWITQGSGTAEKRIAASELVSGKDFYVTFRVKDQIPGISQISASGQYSNKTFYCSEMWFLRHSVYQDMIYYKKNPNETVKATVSGTFKYSVPFNFQAEITKTDKDSKDPLKDVGFRIKYKTGSTWVKQDNKGVISYVSKESEATEFITDSKGKITIKGLLVGDYEAYETKNPNYGYVISKDAITITTSKNKVTVTNEQKYVKLSGYVWEDNPYDREKLTERNDLYQEGDLDKNDLLLAGIPVRLKEFATGEVVKEAVTDTKGAYLFTDVDINKLTQYTIEFEYDGLIYQNVVLHSDKANGSKAVEPNRQTYNDRFVAIEKGEKENQAAIKNGVGNNGTVEATVDYTFTQAENGRTAHIDKTNQCQITADTHSAGYTIPFEKGKAITEVKNINLGIYKRSQTDLAVKTELEQAKVQAAGYGHIYQYGSGYSSADEEKSWDLAVRFESPYKNVYKRPVYRADAEYENTENPSKEMQVALTYKITVANQEAMISRINELVNYFDARYTLKAIGTGINSQDGSILNPYTQDQYQLGEVKNGYRQLVIFPNMIIRPATIDQGGDTKTTQSSIYVQFDLSRQNVLNLLQTASIYHNDENELDKAGENLKNITEIASYTSFSQYQSATNYTLYAAVDKDSVPDNCTAGDTKTYEDDTDKASNLAIVLAKAREVTGTIFEDLPQEALKDKNVSLGDGTYDPEKENAIGGVKVELVQVDESGRITDQVANVFDEHSIDDETGKIGKWTEAKVEAVSGSDGTYTISGFVPGKYIIRYTWGNEQTYKIVEGKENPEPDDYYDSMVENYKSTTIDYDVYEKEQRSDKFYRDVNESNIRTSHAIDDISTRKEIDEILKEYNYESMSKQHQKEMISNTQVMEINIEYSDDDLLTVDLVRRDHPEFQIEKMDFGIIKRPVQSVNFVKTLSDITITLANGQVLINAHIDENGNLQGQTAYLTYVKPIKENGITVQNGFLKAELDSELIQGATVEMKYRLTTENTSEVDYTDERYGYYQYGESYYQKVLSQDKKEDHIVTVTPTQVVDYLDTKSIYRADDQVNKDYNWKPMTLSQLSSSKLVATNVTDAIRNGSYKDENGTRQEIDETQIYSTDYLQHTKLKPYRYVGTQEKPAEGGEVYIKVDKILSSADDANFDNQAEIVLLSKPGGSKPTQTPGNYIPNKVNQEEDDSTSQEIIITPSTGGDKAYFIYITIGITAFAILGIGVYWIKKKMF